MCGGSPLMLLIAWCVDMCTVLRRGEYTGEEIYIYDSRSPLSDRNARLVFFVYCVGEIHRRGEINCNSRSPLCLLV